MASDHEAIGAGMSGGELRAADSDRHATGATAAPLAPAGDAHCPGSCEDPAPSHVMLMVGCVLALLAGFILLLIPLMLGYSWHSLVLAIRSLPLAGGVLPRPRPPSLIILSISRT